MMIIREPDDLPEAKFSLRNTMQCESTLLANIRTGTFVTGGQYSTQMMAVSLCQLMIDLLGNRGVNKNDTQTLTLSTLTGTMGARRGLSRDISLDGRTDMHVLVRGGITAAIHRSDILEPTVRPFSGVIGDAFNGMTCLRNMA